MKRKRSLKALKRELDKAFSLFIRQRDAARDGYVRCVTCGRQYFWEEGHAGHFIKRQHLATRYDERNCHFQDAYCNTYRGGALVEYTLYMQKRYGQSVIDELLQAKHKTTKMTRADYESLLEKYRG